MAKDKEKKKEEDWIQKKWRPMMAIMYMVVCIFDFIVFPVMFTIVQFWETEAANDAFRQWQPLTLVGAGLFHMAMGAVLGITAWSRGQEKIAGVASSNTGLSTVGFSQPQQMNTSFGGGGMYTQTSYNQSPYMQENSYTSVAPVSTGYKGKKAPIQPEDPII